MRMIFCTSPGTCLDTFERTGQLSRLLFHLDAYASGCDRLAFLSYSPTDRRLDSRLDGLESLERIDILYDRFHLGTVLYTLLSPLVWHRAFSRADLCAVGHAPGALPALIAKALYGTPYVVVYGYSYVRIKQAEGKLLKAAVLRQVLRWLLAAADGVIARTHAIATEAQALAPRTTPLVVHNGVALAPLLSCSRDPYPYLRLIYVGRLEPEKSLHVLLAALDDDRLRSAASITIVGDGSLAGTLRQFASDAHLRATFQGTVDNRLLATHFCDADVFVLPSEDEGAPKALIEAMAAGLACVVSNCEGNLSLIASGANGLVFSRGDAASLRECLLRLAADSGLRTQLGKAARDTVAGQYDIRVTTRREFEAFGRVAASGKHRRRLVLGLGKMTARRAIRDRAKNVGRS